VKKLGQSRGKGSGLQTKSNQLVLGHPTLQKIHQNAIVTCRDALQNVTKVYTLSANGKESWKIIEDP